MERSSRLRRYQRKDYTQLVDFPVEIVGRDGQVRRYSYDDSVRLYQRRVRSAPIRYDDSELIDAECRHCRQRIEQLRRSFIERCGWTGLREGLEDGVLSTLLAAEVVAFFRRVFPPEAGIAEVSGPLSAAGSGEVRWVRQEETGRTLFLYLWRLDLESAAEAREEWRCQMLRLSRAPAGEGVERLFVMHEGPDLALLLSGTGVWEGPAPALPQDLVGAEEGADEPEDVDPWTFGQRALHEGAVAEAVRIFERGMELHPLRRSLASAASLLALLDNQPERAEYAARFGQIGHRDDPLLAYLLGVSLGRQGRLSELRAMMAGLAPEVLAAPHPRLLLALARIQQGRMFSGLAALAVLPGGQLVAPANHCRKRALHLSLPLLGALGGLAGAGVVVLLQMAGLLDPVFQAVPATAAGVSVLVGGVTVGVLRATAARFLAGAAPAESRLVSLDLMPRERDPEDDN